MEALETFPKSFKEKVSCIYKLMRGYPLGYTYGQTNDLESTFRVNLGNHFIITRDPKWIKYILQSNHRNYKKGDGYKAIKLILGEGLVSSNGDHWKKQRKLIQPSFHRKRIENLMDTMVTISQRHMLRLGKMKGKNQEVHIDKELLTLSSDIVVTTMLGKVKHKIFTSILDDILETQKYITKLGILPYYRYVAWVSGEQRKFDSMKSELNQALLSIIHTRRSSNQFKDDLLGMLMSAKNAETGDGMSDIELIDEFINIYVAGYETTSTGLSWAFYLLGKNPKVYNQLKQASNLVDFTGGITMETWKQMSYVNAVISETLRLYPPIYKLQREAIDDDLIDGIKIRKGEKVEMSILGLHRDPNIWKNPLDFNPNRFLGEKKSIQERSAYYPFGAGPRKCLGNNFALFESGIILTLFFKHFDFRLVEGQDDSQFPLITLKPRNGIKIFLS